MNTYLDLVIHIVYINTQTYITTVERSETFKATIPITTRENDDICEALDIALQHYNDARYEIMWIHADGEFKSHLYDDLDVKVNIANPDENVGDVESLNRTLPENFRSHYHRLPLKVITQLMVN